MIPFCSYQIIIFRLLFRRSQTRPAYSVSRISPFTSWILFFPSYHHPAAGSESTIRYCRQITVIAVTLERVTAIPDISGKLGLLSPPLRCATVSHILSTALIHFIFDAYNEKALSLILLKHKQCPRLQNADGGAREL